MATKIFISSLKGGAGVTTCAVEISKALSNSGQRTLLFDGDSICASALAVAGLWGQHVYTLADAFKGGCRVKQAILQHPRYPHFYILPSLGCGDKQYAVSALKEIEGLFDYILCDKIALHGCDRAIVVTDPYAPSLKCADKQLAILKDGGFKDVGLIVNKINGGLVFDGEIMTPQEIASILHTPLTAVIPEDLTLPLDKCKKSTANAFKIAAENIAKKVQKGLNVTSAYVGLSGFVKRTMRNKI
jgi:septum formation inhibitor-activating ATPase MinD